MIPAQAREQHQCKTHQQNFQKTHDFLPSRIPGASEVTGLAPARNVGAAYGLVLFRFREGEIWLEFRADARLAIALQFVC